MSVFDVMGRSAATDLLDTHKRTSAPRARPFFIAGDYVAFSRGSRHAVESRLACSYIYIYFFAGISM